MLDTFPTLKKPSRTQPVYRSLWKWQEAGGHIWNLQVPRVRWTPYCPLPVSVQPHLPLCPHSDLLLRLTCSLPTSHCSPGCSKGHRSQVSVAPQVWRTYFLLRHRSHLTSPSRSSSGSLPLAGGGFYAFPREAALQQLSHTLSSRLRSSQKVLTLSPFPTSQHTAQSLVRGGFQ